MIVDDVVIATTAAETTALSARDGEELWTVDNDVDDEGYSDGVVAAEGGVVVVAVSDADYQRELIAFSMADGEEVWAEGVESCSPYSTGTSELLLVGCDGEVFAVDIATGDELWAVDGSIAAAVPEGPILVVDDEDLVAVDPATGEDRWVAELDLPGYADVRMAGMNAALVAVGGDSDFSMLDLAPGEVLWEDDITEQSFEVFGDYVMFTSFSSEETITTVVQAATGDRAREVDDEVLEDCYRAMPRPDGRLLCFSEDELTLLDPTSLAVVHDYRVSGDPLLDYATTSDIVYVVMGDETGGEVAALDLANLEEVWVLEEDAIGVTAGGGTLLIQTESRLIMYS